MTVVGKHRRDNGLGAAIVGRRQALDAIALEQAAEQAEGADIARAIETTKNATDAAWPTNEES